MRQFFMVNGTEVKAFDSVRALKKHITENYDMDAVEKYGLGIHSGVLNGKRYYGESDEGTRVDGIDSLDHITSWWESDWDEEVSEL